MNATLSLTLVLMLPAQRGADVPSRLVVWKLGSQYNLAALLTQRSKDPKVTEGIHGKAKKLAALAGVDLPALPRKGSLPKVLGVVNKANRTLSKAIAAKHGAEHAKLFDLASMPFVLLFVYELEDEKINKKFADGITERARDLRLPERLWRPVVTQVRKKVPVGTLRSAILKMDDDVAAYLQKTAKGK
jgi:hypothetical protein